MTGGRDHRVGKPVKSPGNPPLDAVERSQLAGLLAQLGPDAPTLLDPWTTRDLAAHLVLREHDLLAAPGLVIGGVWARLAERRRTALAQRDFDWLVATIGSGPPRGFFRIPWVRRFPNLNEFFVHHEDVRRANGLAPRVNPPATDTALWHNVDRGSRFLARRLHASAWSCNGRAPGGPSGSGADIPWHELWGRPASCCCFCSADAARRKSRCAGRPRRSTRSGAPNSACDRGAGAAAVTR